MDIYCQDCNDIRSHMRIGTNPDNEMGLYQCSSCDERQEIEDDARSCCACCGEELSKEYSRGNDVFCDETCANDFNS